MITLMQKIAFVFPAYIYLFKVKNRNTGTRYEICFYVFMKYVFIVNFQHISYLIAVFLLLNFNR